MKTMTCRQLGGACDTEFKANTFEEIAEMSKSHGMEMFQKDLSIIGADIRNQGITTPMFDAVSSLYDKGWSLVSKDSDTAAVFEVYRDIDGKV